VANLPETTLYKQGSSQGKLCLSSAPNFSITLDLKKQPYLFAMCITKIAANNKQHCQTNFKARKYEDRKSKHSGPWWHFKKRTIVYQIFHAVYCPQELTSPQY
jgi:hypothetical protein